jgi:hypothetical protein
MDLGRAVVDPERTHLPGKSRQGQVVGYAESATHLNAAVDDAEYRLGRKSFGDRGLVAGM